VKTDLATLPAAIGEWVDWVVHVKFATQGVVEVWRNGVKVVEELNIDNHLEARPDGAYMKFGLYSSQYDPVTYTGGSTWGNPMAPGTSRTVYHDEVRVADATGSYAAVAPNGPVVDYALSEATVLGSASGGSIEDTLSSDNTYEVLTEQLHRNNNKSALDHTWAFDVYGGSEVTFHLEAHHSPNSENDDFRFSYSTDNVNFTTMFRLKKTFDDDAEIVYSLPSDTSGPLYIRVVDTNRKEGNTALDSLHIDSIYIVSE
jgi:hypothetical protein